MSPLPTYDQQPTPKFSPLYSYYTDGSFEPPRQNSAGEWIRETAGYGIYNSSKPEVQLSNRLYGHQNILRAEFMAIYDTLQLLTTEFPHEPAHIFTDCLNCLYLLQTQLKHPTSHNNHSDKTILTLMVELLQQRTQPTSLHKVRAHANIQGNEQADTLAKAGRAKEHRNAEFPHEFAHSTPYFFQKVD